MIQTRWGLLLLLLFVTSAYAENYEVGPDGCIRSIIVPKALMLWTGNQYIRAKDLDTSCKGDVFADVPSASSGYALGLCRSAETMYRLGITYGCAADNPATPENERRYCPDAPLTRGQMAIFLRILLEVFRDP